MSLDCFNSQLLADRTDLSVFQVSGTTDFGNVLVERHMIFLKSHCFCAFPGACTYVELCSLTGTCAEVVAVLLVHALI